ncbi:MAG: mannan-binding protein [Polyangiaceae bacterium]
MNTRRLVLATSTLLGLFSLATGCIAPDAGQPDEDFAEGDAADMESDALATAGDALSVTKTVRVVYIVPSDATRSDRAPLVADAVEHNRQLWSTYGATFHTEPIVTVQSTHTTEWFLTHVPGNGAAWYWLGNACVEAGTAYPEACTWDPDHKYILFLEVDISSANPGVGAAANFGAAVMPQRNINKIENGQMRGIGAIGHELGHTFGMPEPTCDSQEPTKNIMCSGAYYPHNRLNDLDYPYLFTAAHQPYFEESPSDLFDIAPGQVLKGAIWKTQQGMDLNACAASCLADSACSTFVHFGTTCEFKGGTLSNTWSISGYTSAQVKVSKNGTEIKEAGPLATTAEAQQVCPTVCGIWSNLPWTESSWTGQWWSTLPGQMSVCECDYNPDVNP